MEEFIFNGDWEFTLLLKGFSKIYSENDPNKKYNEHYLKLMKGYIPIKIIDDRSYDPDPFPEQLNTLKKIRENQDRFIQNVLKAMEVINADYVGRCGIASWIPDPLTVYSLGQLLTIQEIRILREHKNGIAYTQLECGYRGDDEHGLSIVMHDERLIEYEAQCEVNYGLLYADLGAQSRVIRNVNISKHNFGENQVHQVLPKYGKFKPWQKEATVDYLLMLLRTKDNEALKKIVEDGVYDFNYRIDDGNRNLVDMAAFSENIELVNYLIDKGADCSRTMLECTGAYIKKEQIKNLVKKGVNIDTLNQRNVTALYDEIINYGSACYRIHQYKDKDEYQYKAALYKQEDHQDKICFYLSMGANPYHCNLEGMDYKQVLLTRWKLEFLTANNTIVELEQLIEECGKDSLGKG